MTGYVFRLIPPRPDFASTMSEDERAVMDAHFGYWGALLARGQVIAIGPVADPNGPYGIGIVLAADLAEAEVIRDGDPAMRSHFAFRTEIAPMLRLVTQSGAYDATNGSNETEVPSDG
ncbi:MAG TPA: YciI family protein [Acidimicrobiales bacterium]|nr:YciI family protein [Acidimicrobiales bacterium]